MRTSDPRPALLAIAIFAALAPRAALAQTSDVDRAAALFEEGVALASDADFDAACPKFAASQRLDPSLGTQYNLALCYEKQGKLGSAFRHFRAVEQLARATGNADRERAARQKLEALRPRVPHLALEATDADATLEVDGERLEPADHRFYPVDAGEHTVRATAPGKVSWETRVEAAADGGGIEVVVPPLEIARGETQVITMHKGNPKRTAAFVAGGVGLVGIAAGVVTGLMILDSHATAEERCAPTCDETGREAVTTGTTLLPVNAIAWGVGAAGMAVGTFLFFTSSPKKTSTVAEIVPVLGAGVGGASVVGRF